MRRIIIIANTYYQLIFAMQMKLTIFENEDVVLLLSDHSRNANEVFNGLKRQKLFSQVCFIHSKGLLDSRNSLERLKDFFDISFKSKNRYSFYLKDVDNRKFDELICFNYYIDIIGIYSILSEINSNIKISLFEEGIQSYGVRLKETRRRQAIEHIRKLQGKKNAVEAGDKFYCYYPILYKGPLQPVAVPTVSSDSECSNRLRELFCVDSSKFNYPQRYIFFSSVYDFEGGEPIGELEVVRRLGDLLGRDNLIIKCHPRDNRGIFEKEGFTVDKNSNIPWEVIQLSGDFSDKVFLTATSGSVLAGSFLTNKPITTYYLYKL